MTKVYQTQSASLNQTARSSGQPDREEAARFVEAITGSADTVMDWRRLPDDKSNKALSAQTKRGTLAECFSWLQESNAAGYGVFLTVNETDGRGVYARNITAMRAAFIDDDHHSVTVESLIAGPLPPSLVVASKNGIHAYWALVEEGQDLGDFTPLQSGLAAKFGTDKSIKDLPRVMRVPGFFHAKDPADPFMVRIVHVDESFRGFTVQEIVDAFQIPVGAAPAAALAYSKLPPSAALGAHANDNAPQGQAQAPVVLPHSVPPPRLSRPFERIADKAVAPLEVRKEKYRKYLKKMGPAVEGDGGDSKTFQAARVARDFDLSVDDAFEVMTAWNETCVPPWSAEALLDKIVRAGESAGSPAGTKCAAPPSETAAPLTATGAVETAKVETAPIHPTTVGYEEWPAWDASQGGPNRGPLVNYKPTRKADGEIDDSSDAAVREHATRASQDASAEAKQRNKFVQVQPSGDQIAEHIPTESRYCRTIVVASPLGNKLYRLTPNNLAHAVKPEALRADVFEVCRAMMGGKNPSLETVNSAYGLILCTPKPLQTIQALRWEGERTLALHEVPRPVEGDWSAFAEFLDRCSCPETVKAWAWTCFLSPEEYRGREALIVQGEGNDGKSYFADELVRALGPVATSSELPRDDQRFQLAHLVDKRLGYFGDMRDPCFMRGKIIREILAGAHLAFERKGKDIESAWFHLRCLFTMNPFPKILTNDRAERTRVRLVTVAPLPPDKQNGDSTWPLKLRAQMPAFLFECRRAYERLMTGRPAGEGLPETEACARALEHGMASIDDDFDYLASRLEFTGSDEDHVPSTVMGELIAASKCKPSEVYNWLRSKGSDNRLKKINKKPIRAWHRVRKLVF